MVTGAALATANRLPVLLPARASEFASVIHVEAEPLAAAPGSGGWWDVPVAEASPGRPTIIQLAQL
jgi:TPP-dependent trihydroxycyclohexane-1,2-dione (THcHDO) dehydratase